ncbi:integrator complex subunit 9 [Tetranychus urticae]|uniref:Beta-Casp domain-containing protein n=1 Tax=Tetranychus urticae TaxID=32264 RepID=T1KMB1_TETUR|nr:integrator complex subunit 9 [Tetranychus urticae]
MKLISLSDNVNKPCNLVQFKDTLMMFDCGLDALSTLGFIPLPLVTSNHFSSLPNWTASNNQDTQLESELKECDGKVFVDSAPEFCCPEFSTINFKHVDVIFVSNYLCMLGLPYITERTDFEGVVYATEPTIQIGRQFMEEIIYHIERTPKIKLASKWKDKSVYQNLPLPVNLSSLPPHLWRQIFTSKELNSSFSKVKVIGYGEKIDIFGAFQISAHSSGYCIGSCNWLIETAHEKIVYLSSTSTLTTHPKPIDYGPFRKADVMIITNLTQTPICNPDNMLAELCSRVTAALASGGNVLIPCYPSGVIYDLFECLIPHLDNSGFSTTPVYFVSPVADQSLAYSNILAEWLTTNKQTRVYLPEEPFGHSYLVRSGRLKHYQGIHVEAFSNDYKSPCVVFTGHPSLRFGDVVHFIELWKSSPNNLIVFTEPDFPYKDALAPYQPVAMKAIHCPIDTSLNFFQVNKLIREVKPSNVVISEKYTSPPPMFDLKTDLIVDPGPGSELITYKRNETIRIKLNRKYERAAIDSELASSLVPVELKSGVSVATVTGTLIAKDNKFKLETLTANEINEIRRNKQGQAIPPQFYTYGTLNLPMFMQLLGKAGIYDATIEQTPNGCIVHLRSEDAFVTIDDSLTHIVCDANDSLRILLKDLVYQCLKKI